MSARCQLSRNRHPGCAKLGHPVRDGDVSTRDALPSQLQLISPRNTRQASSREPCVPAFGGRIHNNAHELAGGVIDGKGAAVLADAIGTSIPSRRLRDFVGGCGVAFAHSALCHWWGCGPRPPRVPARAGAPSCLILSSRRYGGMRRRPLGPAPRSASLT